MKSRSNEVFDHFNILEWIKTEHLCIKVTYDISNIIKFFKNAKIRKLLMRAYAQKDMHLENMALHVLITTNVYSELIIATQMLSVLIMVVGFTVIVRLGFQESRLRD